jgi:Ca-activated chloride channel family protein
MSSSDKLPLLKEGFQKMVAQLNEKDRVAIVVYASNAGTVIEPTICDKRGRDLIIGALGRLNSGGSTAGAGGIKEAYKLLQKNFIPGGTNRVILATDGDFNVGVSSNTGLINLVKEKAKQKAYLTVMGFGQGNLNDHMMEEISNKGNGNYFYIDSAKESTRVMCSKLSRTLVTIAKDVKIQVEFNPTLVHSYRLIGYDNRRLKDEDFNNDKKDAGEIGAGHNVTALYEIVPVGSANARAKIDNLKYQPKKENKAVPATNNAFSNELMTVKLRYKSPEGGPSTLLKYPVKNDTLAYSEASKDFIFSSSAAVFGMLLKGSEYSGNATYEQVASWIEQNKALKDNEERLELLTLIKLANKLKNGNKE